LPPRPSILAGKGRLTGQKVRMPMFAAQLAPVVGRTVLDRTGLPGEYDYKLEWTPHTGQSSGSGGDPDRPSVFTAIQEQLGLRLESTKGPVEIVVIDHVEKASEN
jgi:uncharacterized protein (TIGR03435 family)